MPNVSNALNQIRHLGFVIYVFGPPTEYLPPSLVNFGPDTAETG